MYHVREHKFSLSASVDPWMKYSGVAVRAKYFQKESGLLYNAQLIKLLCAPLPCRSVRCFFSPSLSNALPVRPITLKHVFVLTRSNERVCVCVF